MSQLQKRRIEIGLGERGMTIGEYLRKNDIDTYRKLMMIGRRQQKIKLGDKPERLMQHDSHKRIGRRIKQTKWW